MWENPAVGVDRRAGSTFHPSPRGIGSGFRRLKRERLPDLPQNQRFEDAPDWVCGVLSPSTVDTDRKTKMRIHADSGVDHVWLANPVQRVLEAYRLNNGE
jgi:Uma2 family endonuclease